MRKWQKIILVSIFILAFILRFYKLGEVPAGFHADEAAFGYNAYSLLKTGQDEYGKFLPLVLQSFDDYKPALYAYLDIPFVASLGLNSLTVRLPSAIFSLATVIFFYFWVQRLFGSQRIAFLSSFLLAISPWHIVLSRVVTEAVVSLFFLLLFSYSLLILKEKFSLFWFILSLFTSTLAFLSYTASRFFVVLIGTLFLFWSASKMEGRLKFNRAIVTVLILIFVLGLVFSLLTSIARFRQINIFTHPETRLVLEEQIREDASLPVLLTRLFHNKPHNYFRTFLQNYSHYFTLDFLFLSGGYPQRVRTPSVGLFYLWQLPFLLLGIVWLLVRKRNLALFLCFWWLLLLGPAAVTFDEVPNIYRGLVVLPSVLVLIAVGFDQSLCWLSERKLKWGNFLLLVLALIIVYELSYYSHQYLIHGEVHRPWYRHFGYKELVEYIVSVKAHYKKIYITKSHGSPYIFFLFYQKYDPKAYWVQGSPRDKDWGGFENYIFSPDDCPLKTRVATIKNLGNVEEAIGEPRALYVNRGECTVPKRNARLLKTILRKDNTPAFRILEYVE